LKLFWDRERPASSDFTLGKKKKFAEVISIGRMGWEHLDAFHH
jgi:hypothetical protein